MDFINIKTDNEIRELELLAHDIWHEYWPCLLKEEQINYMLSKFQSYDSIKSQIETENYIYNIVKINNEIAGYFGVCSKPHYFFLSKLYIKKDFRGKGTGRNVFEKIKQLTVLNNQKSIILTVNKYNKTSIEAYKKWGFKIIDSAVTDIGSGFVMDDYIMEFKI